MNCLDPNTPQIPTLYQGQDKSLGVTLTSTSTKLPVDLTGASEIVAILPNTDGTFLEKKLSTNGIVLVSGPGGQFQIVITATDSAALQANALDGNGLPTYTDIEVHYVLGGLTTIVVLSQAVQILARRYPAAP